MRKLICCPIGGIDRVYADTERPVKVQAGLRATGQEPTVPSLSNIELDSALTAALVRQFEQRSPTGEVVKPAPSLVAFYPDSKEIIYQQDGRLFRATYLLNFDGTVAIGEGLPVRPDFVAASAIPSRRLAEALITQFRPWKSSAGEADPRIVGIGPKTIIAAFSSTFMAFPYEFQQGGQVLLGSYREVEQQGGTFAPPSTIDPKSRELNALAVSVQRAMADHGRTIDFGRCLIAAELVIKTAQADRPREFPAILTMLFNKV